MDGVMGEKDELVPVEIKALMLDPSSNLPIVILHDDEKDRYLPIWIGLFEAQAIAMVLEEVEAARPMTHDLLFDALSLLEVRIVRVVITDLQESTFHAQIVLETAGKERFLDARPSDSIALALRAGAGILVSSGVMEKALSGEQVEQFGTEDEVRKWLEDADPEAFGKYKM